MTAASAADPAANSTAQGTSQTASHTTIDQTNKQANTTHNHQETETAKKTKPKAAGNTAVTKQVTTPSTVKATDSQIKAAAASVKTYVEKNKRLPSYVTVGSNTITLYQYLQLVSRETVNLYGSKGALTVKTVGKPTSNTDTVKSGNVKKADYVKLAKNVLSFISKNGRVPNYGTTKLGKLRFENMVYTFSKIVAYHKSNGRLPNYVAVKPWKTVTAGSTSTEGSTGSNTTISSALQKYLVQTKNAQSNNATIKNLAKTITAGKTTAKAKATAVFNWVRDHLSYTFYYNTRKGALGALSSRTGNCVDTSHLVVALSRAAGVPARYQHGTCKFSSGTYGHVWAQLYVGGKWLYADAISNSNTLGTIKNWNLKSYTLHGTYASLPF